MKEPRVKSVMTPFPHSVELDAPIERARELMLKHQVRHLPVTEAHALRGIVSDRDLRLVQGPELAGTALRNLTVKDAYLGDCYAVDLETPLRVVLAHMAERHIGAAVITAHGRLAGIFTATDACRAFAAHLARQFGPADPGGPPAVA